MKILFSIHHELDGDAGAPGVTMRIARALEARGHDVKVLSHGDSPGRGLLRTVLFPFVVFAYVWRHPEFDVLDLSSGDGWFVNFLRRWVRWRPAQRSFTRSHGLEHTVHEFVLEDAEAAGRPVSWKYPLYHGGFRLWECRQSFVWADGSLMLNKYDADYLQTKFGIASQKVFRVANAVDDAFLEVARRMLDAGEATENTTPRGIAYVGSWLERKGVRYLAQALNRLLADNPTIFVGLFGTGEGHTAEIYEAFAPEYHERIYVTPRFTNLELPSLLADYSVLAFPTLTEGFPLGPIEAMACGLVPVTADTPGPTEYIHHERNGLVVPKRDAEALRFAMQRLLDDPALYACLRKRARETAVQYSWGAIAAQTEAIYRARGAIC